MVVAPSVGLGQEDQESEEASEPEAPVDAEALAEEVVVTGTRTRHTLSDSPVPVELVTPRDIRSSGSRDAGDALNNVTGIFVDDYETAGRGGPGSGVNLHGLPTDRVLILIDGQRIPKTMRAPDLEVIPANIIERIEVVKGPSSALYGSDAEGGVINIITRKPAPRVEVEGEAGYGSFNTYRANLLHSSTFGPFGYLLAVNREASEGWIDRFTQKSIIRMGIGPDGFTQVKNDPEHPYDLNDLFGKWRLAMGTRAAWRGQARYHWEGNSASDTDGGSYDDDKTRLDVQTGFDFDLGSAGSLAVTGYGFRHTFRYRQYESVYVWDLLDPDAMSRSFIDKGNDTVTDNYRGEAVHTVPFGSWNLLTSGLDFRYETLAYDAFEFSLLTDEDQDYSAYQSILSAFAQDEIFLFRNRWSLVPGGRIDYHPVWGAVGNPKFSTLVKAVETSPYALALRASVGQAFKEPSLSQLYRKEFRHTGYYLTGNEDLKPERALGWNAEIDQRLFRHVNLKLGYFQYEIDDMIWTDVIAADYIAGFPLMAYRNVKQARTYGFESGLRLTPHDFVSLHLHHTYTRTLDLESDEILGTVAEHQVGGQVFFDIEPWGFGGYLAGNYMGERDYIGMGGLWYTAEPLWTTKARLYKRLFGHLELYLEATNWLDATWDREGDKDNDLPPLNLFGGIKAWL